MSSTSTSAQIRTKRSRDPGPTPNPPASFGWSSVKAYNCAIHEERINLWTIDLATGERKSTGPIDALYNENGGCPDGRDPPIYIDVIVYDYEPNQHATRPRTVADVDIKRLQSAVLAASNERNGTHETNFTKLLGPEPRGKLGDPCSGMLADALQDVD